MAKNEVMKALATLRESGLELTEEQSAALEEFSSQAMTAEAVKVFERKLTDAITAPEWAEQMFELASAISTEIVGEDTGRGRGFVHIRMFRVETPHGSLKVELGTPVE